MVPSVRHAGAAQIGFDLREAGPIADAAVSHAGSGLCGASLRSSALSGFLPVRPGSRAEGGAAIPGLDGQAAGLGVLHAVAGGMTPVSFSGGQQEATPCEAGQGRHGTPSEPRAPNGGPPVADHRNEAAASSPVKWIPRRSISRTGRVSRTASTACRPGGTDGLTGHPPRVVCLFSSARRGTRATVSGRWRGGRAAGMRAASAGAATPSAARCSIPVPPAQ
jgi:hypothetical protein